MYSRVPIVKGISQHNRIKTSWSVIPCSLLRHPSASKNVSMKDGGSSWRWLGESVRSAREEVEVDDIFAPIIVFVVCVAVFVRNSIWREDSRLNGIRWMVDGRWSHCRGCHRRTAAVRMMVVAIRRWLQLWGICLLVVLLFVACDDENVDDVMGLRPHCI